MAVGERGATWRNATQKETKTVFFSISIVIMTNTKTS